MNPAPVAAISATRNAVSAVASLNRLSPTSTVTVRRGRPRRCATLTAATASGGATIAPSTHAAASGSPGTRRDAAYPTANVVNSTSPIDSSPIDHAFSRRLVNELFHAAENSSGGRTT